MHSEHQKQQIKGHSVLLKDRDSDILQINVQKRSGNRERSRQEREDSRVCDFRVLLLSEKKVVELLAFDKLRKVRLKNLPCN